MLLAIALSTVLGIDIESSSSYKGQTNGRGVTHIVRSGSDFVSHGKPVPAGAVEALIDALNAPAMSEPTPESLRVGGTALDTLATSSVQECSGVSATQAAQDVYRSRFTDATVFASFLRSYYAKPPPPDGAVPALRITVTSGSDQVIASSSSSKAGMLPFTIVRGVSTATTYDASLSEAVGALLSMSYASRTLRMESLDGEWARTICDRDMMDIAFQDALPQTFAFANEHGLVLHGTVEGNPIDGVTATVWKADIPRIALLYNADVRGGDPASVLALQDSSNILHRIAVIPWLQRVLAANPAAVVSVDDPSLNGSFLRGAEVDELRNAGFGHAASLLAANLQTAPSFWVGLKPDKGATQWYLMPNGNALLVHYLAAEERLPLDPQTSALIHSRGKLFGRTPTITVGAVVTPAGTFEP
jgi:hypothetical protein